MPMQPAYHAPKVLVRYPNGDEFEVYTGDAIREAVSAAHDAHHVQIVDLDEVVLGVAYREGINWTMDGRNRGWR